ncbi:MAG: ABC transporter ATP-binding protein [Elusimicrobiota bacterium]|jgi:iron complex transport system ATP-binding protein|nr:ABC transporter ATP-binding protein [Elusimicrobiota bacterium]
MIEIKNLFAGYKNFNVLKDINLCIEKGSFNAIIGKNGCGKSTLLKTICRLIKPSFGKVEICGQNINKFSYSDFAKIISYMPQNNEIDFAFKIRDFVVLGRCPYMNFFKIASKKDWQKADEAIDFMGLSNIANCSVKEISGGQFQKVLIAQIIAQDAEILILDEPTSHLDMGSVFTILNFLKSINEKFSKTIILALHDLNIAFEFCQNIILLEEGKVLISACADEILKTQIIQEIYNLNFYIGKNPISKKSFIIPITQK